MNFLEIQTIEDLAMLLGVNSTEIKYFSKYTTPLNAYTSFKVPKKNGSFREIVAPNRQLKFIQKLLLKEISCFYDPKINVHGFVPKRNIRTNAEPHICKKVVLNVDIDNFFPSIHIGRVIGMFMSKPFSFSQNIAVILARLTTNNGILPQGSPTSPIISNLICRNLDNELKKLTLKFKLVYTRYADDITISTKKDFLPIEIVTNTPEGWVLSKSFCDIFENNSFRVNHEKTKIRTYTQKQKVTGLIVNKKVNIENRQYKEFKSLLYNATVNGIKNSAYRNKFVSKDGKPNIKAFTDFIIGKMNYYRMILGDESNKFNTLAIMSNKLFGKKIFHTAPRFVDLCEESIFVIEYNDMQGTAFYLNDYGLVTSLHNIWKIGRPVDLVELKEILTQTRIYLPKYQNKFFEVAYKSHNYDSDLLLLSFVIHNNYPGFKVHELYPNTQMQLSYFGYPNHSNSNSIDSMNNIRIRQVINRFGVNIYSVDKNFIVGSSGSPIFENQRVIGVLSHGNSSASDTTNPSCFYSIKNLETSNSESLQDEGVQ